MIIPHLSIIHHEKKTRTKTDYPEHRARNCPQHPGFPSVQQFAGSSRLSDDPGLYFCGLDGFRYDLFCNHKKI